MDINKKKEHEERTQKFVSKYRCPKCEDNQFKTNLQENISTLTCKNCGHVQETNTEELLEYVKDLLRPEVRKIVEAALKDKTTKHGYGMILEALGEMDKEAEQRLLLVIAIEEGYPAETARQIADIMGWKNWS